MRIRRLRVDDVDAVFGKVSVQFADEWLRRQERGEVYVAVAEVNGVPVGRVGLDFVRSGEPGVAILWAAHVEPDWQSRGIGTLLFRHLEEEVALARGFSVIELLVGKENERARSLYGRLGYETCGQGVDRWSYRGEDGVVQVEEDCWVMRKRLIPDPDREMDRTGRARGSRGIRSGRRRRAAVA